MIEPNSKLRLHAYIPLDVEHVNTILFPSVSAQNKYFENAEHTFTKLQYVRQNNNSIKLPISADEAYKYNYMSFQNTTYGSKWFYAFITSVDYLNDNACIVNFKVDVIQTYMFDYTLPMCYVVREHASTDNIGDNIQPEPFNIGDMIVDKVFKDHYLNDFQIVVCAGTTINLEGQKETSCGVYGGLLQGVDLLATGIDVTPSNYEQASNHLKDIINGYVDANAEDSIISLFNMPSKFLTANNKPIQSYTESLNKPKSLDGYTPKNKKLLTFPYCYLAVDTGANCANYRWEYFTGEPSFNMYGTYTCNPEVALVPLNYNGFTENFTEQIKVGNFGQVAFSVDTYRAWLAQNANAWNLKMYSASLGVASASYGALTGVFSGEFGNVANVAQSTISYEQVMNEKAMAQNQAPHAKGQQQTDLDLALNKKGFWFKNMSMRAENAKIADDFLTMFGYATNKLKTPNITSRKEFNYLQTSAINIYGSVPNDASAELADIYNRGIRFWHNPKHVGDYSLNNSIK